MRNFTIALSVLLLSLASTAQSPVQTTDTIPHLTTLCIALESYKVDANGYPETLDALFPTYIKEKPEGFGLKERVISRVRTNL